MTPTQRAHASTGPVDQCALPALLDDPLWRLANLYKIIVKDETDPESEGLVVQFRPNRVQQRILKALHTRNLILKARQLGCTTLITLLWLDTALFSKSPIRCGIIAHEKDAAEAIFKDKVLFAYEHLPAEIRGACPLLTESATELKFSHNGASVRVATSMRSGTMHRLLVSEFGKICAKYPLKAREVITGSLPTVPTAGITVIESTAEGQDGAFFEMSERARALSEQRVRLSPRDYRFHFFPWWEAPEYALVDEGDAIVFSEADLDYFLKVEGKIGRPLSDGQRRWYVATRRADFGDDAPLMWQEYPSYPAEAFQVSTEGCYFAAQLANARRHRRILPQLPIERGIPVYTFWDLGRSDMTTIWFMQRVGPEHRFIRYYENSGEELAHYAEYLLKQGYVYARHWVPHDAGIKRLGETRDTNLSQKEIIEKLLPGHSVEIVPKVTIKQSGIQAARHALSSSYFSEEGCNVGLKRLGSYRKQWDPLRGMWKDEPMHDDASHGADSYMQFAQLLEAGETFGGGQPVRVVRHEDGTTTIASRRGWGKRRRGGGGRPGMSA